mgnify:CR=1 FL=1
MSNPYITIREAAQMLHVSEKIVLDLVENQKLKAYKIADKFLRLNRAEVAALGHTGQIEVDEVPQPYTFGERIRDFFYFNDFYIASLGVVAALLYWILLR